MNIRNLTWLAAAIVIAGGTSVRAQGVTVELTGVITSTAGGPVDGAVIQIRNAETGFLRMATADANGRYRAVALPVGPYFVTVTKGGFKAAANIRITLTLTSAAPLNIKLAPEAGATVEVIATEAAIDSERASAAAFISTDDLKNMPTLNRSFTGLATLRTSSPASSCWNNAAPLAGRAHRSINASRAAPSSKNSGNSRSLPSKRRTQSGFSTPRHRASNATATATSPAILSLATSTPWMWCGK